MVITQNRIATGKLCTTNMVGLRSLEPVQEGELYLEYSRVAPGSASRLNQQQWNLAKVNIQRDELQPVLQRNRCDPDIVARNGAAPFSQIQVNLRISQCGFLSDVQNADRGFT